MEVRTRRPTRPPPLLVIGGWDCGGVMATEGDGENGSSCSLLLAAGGYRAYD